MDDAKRQIVEEHVAEADRHVAEGERLIERQRATIAERRRDGHNVKLAEQLLGEMEQAQRLHIQERTRLYNEWRAMLAPSR